MAQVTLDELEQRVEALEKLVVRMVQPEIKSLNFNNWRKTVGMFAGDELMKKIDEAGRRIREADRRKSAR